MAQPAPGAMLWSPPPPWRRRRRRRGDRGGDDGGDEATADDDDDGNHHRRHLRRWTTRRRVGPPRRPCVASATLTGATPAPASTPASSSSTSASSAPFKLLPLWESRPGADPQQYALDRGVVRLLLPEEADALRSAGPGERGGDREGGDAGDARSAMRVQWRRAERTRRRVVDAFLPCANAVTPDYWAYAKFRFAQRVASSCITVFATQQMLQAVGLGATRRLPAAAAVNWVLKDGLGRLGKLSVATNFGREFDSDVKRFRFTSSVVYDCASLIEMITPFYPSKFLLLATIANVGKSVGITTANVVRAPIQMSFALEENLAEIAAKTSAQQVLADNIGLALAVVATGWTGKIANPRLRLAVPLLAFAPLASVDLYCIYRELKSVRLRTINKERGEIIAAGFVETGTIPSAVSVAAAERLFIPARMDESSLPLKITHLAEACPTPEALRTALGDDPSRPYCLTYLPPRGKKGVGSVLGGALRTTLDALGGWEKKKRGGGLKGSAFIALSARASSRDVMQAVLQVAHLRCLPFRVDLSASEGREWATRESATRAARDVDEFMRQLEENDWQTGKVLLSSAERAPYAIEGGADALTRALAGTEGTEGARGGESR